MCWIKNKDKEKIQNIFKDINKNFVEISKILYEKYNNNPIEDNTLEIYNLSKNKIKEYINIYKFIKKYNITNPENIGLLKLKLCSKIKNENLLNDILPNLENLELKHLKEKIKNENIKSYKKTFELYENDIELFNQAKEIIRNITNEHKLSNSQIFRYILADFISSNIDYLKEN